MVIQPLPPDSGVHILTLPTGTTLLEMVKKTSFAISSDETRYILNGVFFEPRDGGKVRMVATDGHRLALIERELSGDFKLKHGVIVPRNIALDPSGRWLLVCGQASNEISVLEINPTDGKIIRGTDNKTRIDSPMCVTFAKP